MKNRVVAITGGIGSGKSSVTEILRSLGHATIDCDQLARTVATLSETVDAVRKLLGDDFVLNGELNRPAIRNKIFSDELLLSKYNAIFFDKVRKLLVESLQHTDGDVFVEISVFDAFEFPWDEVWLIESRADERKRRVMKRDGSSEANVSDIIARQRICDSYSLKIVNNGNLSDLKQQIIKALHNRF